MLLTLQFKLQDRTSLRCYKQDCESQTRLRFEQNCSKIPEYAAISTR